MYTSYVDRVAVAANEALLVDPSQSPGYYSTCAVLHDLPDDAPYNLNNETSVRRPGQAIIENADEYPELIDALHEVTGIDPGQYQLGKSIAHEKSHKWAADRLGAIGSLFGLQLERRPESPEDRIGKLTIRSLSYMPIKLDTTKLGIALVSLQPKDLLDFDLLDAVAMGYPGGVEEVGDLALTRNLALPRGEQWLPIPLNHPYWRAIRDGQSRRTSLGIS